MNNNLLSIIKKVTAEQGESILSDPKRVAAAFSDIAKDIPKPQKNAFIKCLEHKFAQALKSTTESERANCKEQLAQKLHEEEGLDVGLCNETLDLLEIALYGEQEKKLPCTNCGKNLQEDWIICPYCATSCIAQKTESIAGW